MSSFRDIMLISIILFVTGIALLVVFLSSHTILTAVGNNPVISNNTQATTVLASGRTAIDQSDYTYLIAFIAFFLMIMVISYFVGGHPVASIIFYIALTLIAFVSLIFQQVWIYLTTTSAFSTTVSTLPKTNYILSHLTYFIVIIGLLSMVIMYAKQEQYLPSG